MEATPLESHASTAAFAKPTAGTGASPAGALWFVDRVDAAVSRPPRSVMRRYGVAFLAVLAATILSHLLGRLPGSYRGSALLFGAVMVSAWYGGLGPGLMATVLAGFSVAFFVIEPIESIQISFEGFLSLSVFLATAVLISSLTALRWKAEEALQEAHDDLERRVRDRTAALWSSNESLQTEITERRRVEHALRQSEERFRLLVEGVEDYAMFILDPGGHVVSWNPGAERITGYREEEITGRRINVFFPSEDVEKGKPEQLLQAAASAPDPAVPLPAGAVTAGAGPPSSSASTTPGYEDEGWRVRKDGSRFWANVLVTPLRDEQGSLRGFAQVMRDITERKNLEAAILEISEREQRRIGHDLHDGLGQELTGIAFLSKVLEQRLTAVAPPEAAEARQIAELVNQTIKQTREMARGLSPVELDVDGLASALHQLAKRIEGRFGISCTVDWDRSVTISEHATATHLYRIAQEAVSNAIRHGDARHVVIRLAHTEREIALTVTDDGVGFPEGVAPSKGMGLHVMSYRARTVGGSLEVARAADGGTIVTCAIPRVVEEAKGADATALAPVAASTPSPNVLQGIEQ
jgi:signal transduction histidine kinase